MASAIRFDDDELHLCSYFAERACPLYAIGVGTDTGGSKYHKWFLLIVVADVICFWMVSFFGIECPTIRFLGFSVLNAVSTTLWVMVIRDSINNALNGVELTNWQAKSGAFGLYGAFAGGLVAIFVPNINVEFCILLQCISNMFMGITDLIAYKKMQREAKE